MVSDRAQILTAAVIVLLLCLYGAYWVREAGRWEDFQIAHHCIEIDARSPGLASVIASDPNGTRWDCDGKIVDR